MLRRIRIFIIQQFIEINERILFNIFLLNFYKKNFRKPGLNSYIDVGANLGQTIDIVLKVNPKCKIIAFEPNPSLYKKLEKKYHSLEHIHLYPFAVSDENGNKEFYENVLHSTSSLEELNLSSNYLIKKSKILGVSPQEIIKNKYKVEVVKLSTFLEINYPNEKFDAIKIDTEGHEYYCLKGLFEKSFNNIRFIQLENRNDDMYKNNKTTEEIINLLNSNNFHLIKEIKHGFGGIEELFFENTNYKK